MDFLLQICLNQSQLPKKEVVVNYSRRLQTKRMATLFDKMTDSETLFPGDE